MGGNAMTNQQLLDGAYVITSVHEPHAFYKRSGRDTIRLGETYEALHTEETVLELKRLGLTMLRNHYHKGMGFEAERKDRERAAKLTALCHKHGIYVQAYIQFGTLHPETYKAEEPDYEDWPMRDRNGNPITLLYGHQNFRHHPCPNRPGYWAHLKRVTKEAIIDAKVDAVGFDNVSWAEEPDVCHCGACKAGFTTFLKERYPTDEAATGRFGYPVLDYIIPPAWNFYNHHYNLTELRQPVLQEWAEFRCLSLKRRVDEMYAYCKSLNPDVLVEINAFRQTGQNTAFTQGLYLTDLAAGCDAFWGEMEPEPGWHVSRGESKSAKASLQEMPGHKSKGVQNGRLYHKARAYKTLRALGKLFFTSFGHYNHGDAGEKAQLLAMSESMAFQGGCLNKVHILNRYTPMAGDPLHKTLREFSLRNRALYGAEPVAAVHVYESRASLSYSNFNAHYENILLQQTLLRKKIPYAILHGLDDLSGCRAVALPGTMCLTEGEIGKLVAFARNGGGLILTGDAGDFNERYVFLEERSLRARLGFGSRDVKDSLLIGRGKAAAFPKLDSPSNFASYEWAYKAFEQPQIWAGHESWEAPHNMEELAGALRWALNHDLPLEVSGPEPLIAELTAAPGKQILHLLNYDVRNPARAVTVRFGEPVKSARLHNPFTGDVRPLELAADNTAVVDRVDIYVVVEAELR
jgi:hypothetical protein